MPEIELTGPLAKMKTQLLEPVAYQLPVGDQLVDLQDWVGATVALDYLGTIHCLACGRSTKKSFNQGYCYPCMRSLARCDSCIVRPELCHFAEGTCREPDWAERNCFQTHVVYLANSSGLKVGITRGSQVPVRWMDQGAVQALPILEVGNRLLAGKVEVMLKADFNDRTDWRKMLRGNPEPQDLISIRDQQGPNWLQAATEMDPGARLATGGVINIDYPVSEYPDKVRSLTLDKSPEIKGILKGIKGQYLILDTGVFNVRRHGGYQVRFSARY